MLNQALKKRSLHRAKIIMGQVKGLLDAIDKERYCPEILEQSKAVINSLKSLESFILENHIRSHLKDQLIDEKVSEKAVKELVKIYKL